MNNQGYFEFKDLAVLKIGGAHPRNISILTERQNGKTFLLPSFPPRSSFEFKLRKHQKSIFDLKFSIHLRPYFIGIADMFKAGGIIEEQELMNELDVIIGLSAKQIIKLQQQVKHDSVDDWADLDEISKKLLKLQSINHTTKIELIKQYNRFIASNLAYWVGNNTKFKHEIEGVLNHSRLWLDVCDPAFEFLLSSNN